jgi:hypothetical protein
MHWIEKSIQRKDTKISVCYASRPSHLSVEVGRLDSGNLFFGTSLFSGWDEEEILGLPPAGGVQPSAAVQKPPDTAITVRSAVNTRRDSVRFSTEESGKTGTLRFVFDNLEPCTMKLKFKAPYAFSLILSQIASATNTALANR